VVVSDQTTNVVFYVKANPAQGVLAATTGQVKAATSPNTGRGDLPRALLVAVFMLLMGVGMLLAQGYLRPYRLYL
jgi:hypothetical protein